MSMTYKQLREASDQELIRAHDHLAEHMEPGTGYYLDELARRETERLTESIKRLTAWNTALVVVSTLFVAVSTVFVVLDVLRG